MLNKLCWSPEALAVLRVIHAVRAFLRVIYAVRAVHGFLGPDFLHFVLVHSDELQLHHQIEAAESREQGESGDAHEWERKRSVARSLQVERDVKYLEAVEEQVMGPLVGIIPVSDRAVIHHLLLRHTFAKIVEIDRRVNRLDPHLKHQKGVEAQASEDRG